MSEISLDSRPRPTTQVRGRMLEQEAVLVLPAKGEVKVLNEVGARIWALADGSRSVSEIAAVIVDQYEVPLAQAQVDTLAFLNELHAKALVEW